MKSRAGLDAAVEIDRRDERLEAVGENRVLLPAAGLLFSAPEQHVAAEIDFFGQPRERRRRDDAGLHLRLVALAVGREPREQQIGDDEAEHGVAEELERLVVDDAAGGVLVRARSVRQRVLEQAEVAELVVDAFFERAERSR